jgi:hypothetical protein
MKIATTFPNYDEFWISIPEHLEFREWTKAFSSVGIYQTIESNVSAPERPQRVRTMLATHDLFTTLRVNPRIGRTFEEADNVPGAGEVAILSDGLWRSTFGGDRAIVGRAVEIQGVKRVIVGVMPRVRRRRRTYSALAAAYDQSRRRKSRRPQPVHDRPPRRRPDARRRSRRTRDASRPVARTSLRPPRVGNTGTCERISSCAWHHGPSHAH